MAFRGNVNRKSIVFPKKTIVFLKSVPEEWRGYRIRAYPAILKMRPMTQKISYEMQERRSI